MKRKGPSVNHVLPGLFAAGFPVLFRSGMFDGYADRHVIQAEYFSPYGGENQGDSELEGD